MTKEGCLGKVTRNGRTTLPTAARRAAGIREGDTVAVAVEGNTIVLSPGILKGQAYFWTKRWQKGEREASQDIAEARVTEFGDVEGLIATLAVGVA